MEAPVEETAEEQRPEQCADRRVAAEQRDGDADEADLDERDVELADLVVRAPPSMSMRPRKAGERAGDRHRADEFFFTLIPPYAAASGLKPTARTS